MDIEKTAVSSITISSELICGKPYYFISYVPVGSNQAYCGFSSFSLEDVWTWRENALTFFPENSQVKNITSNNRADNVSRETPEEGETP